MSRVIDRIFEFDSENKPKTLQAQVDWLDTNVEALTENVRTLEDRVRNKHAEGNKLREEVVTCKQKIDELRGVVAHLEKTEAFQRGKLCMIEVRQRQDVIDARSPTVTVPREILEQAVNHSEHRWNSDVAGQLASMSNPWWKD